MSKQIENKEAKSKPELYTVLGVVKDPLIVNLNRYEKTNLERDLDKQFGYKKRTILDDVEKTYIEAISEFGTLNIKIKTNLIEAQMYKVGMNVIEIVN